MRSQRRLRLKDSCAFTLVELLIVDAILGVMTSIAIPMFYKYKLSGYKAELDSDARNVYVAAQAYLTENTGATVDTLSELITGGYMASPNVMFQNGSITVTSGNIEIYSSALKAQNKDNNSVIFASGNIDFVNAPF